MHSRTNRIVIPSRRAAVLLCAYAERHWSLVCILSALALTLCWARQITDSPIQADPVDTVQMAVNLVHHGVLSDDRTVPPQPSMYREPLPAVSAAAGVMISDWLWGVGDPDSYLTGERAKILKYQNMFWKALTSLSAYAALVALIRYRSIALLGAILIGLRQPYVDTLYSEPIAAAFLTLGATLLVIGMRRRNPFLLLLCGASFGLLALVKAIFPYIFIALLVCLAILQLVWHQGLPRRTVVRNLGALAISFLAITLPWMVRNQAQFGTTQISERGGIVLYLRALEDQMTWEEYRGSFYVWSLPRVRALVGAITGFGPRDLERGGRLQRLGHESAASFAASDKVAERSGRPDQAVSIYRQARAERTRLEQAYKTAGNPNPEHAADTELTRRALALIMAHPVRHLAFVLPFIWQGAVVLFPLLVLTLIYAARTARQELLLFSMPAFGLLLIYAFATDFEPRFSTPAVPCILVGVIALLVDTTKHLMAKTRSSVLP